MKVAVGSQNPVKIEAAQRAFGAVWPEEKWEVCGVEVLSGVSAQPMSDEESIRWARNRAQQAIEKTGADYSVGLEGGLHKIGAHYFDCGWVVVIDRDGAEGIGSTARVMTPRRIMELIHQGMELGAANDIVFSAINSKQKEGHFGLMTKNVITRSDGYMQGVVMALSRFVHPQLF